MEAVNKETLNTAFTRYQEQGIMLVTRQNTPKPWSEISLTEQFVPQREDGILVPKGPLWDLVEHIGRFRMEGKNRRDSATGKEEDENKGFFK